MLARLLPRLAVAFNVPVALCYVLLIVPVLTQGLPLSSDFTAFYTGWQMTLRGERLYDLDAQREAQAEFMAHPFLPYLNPPHSTPPFAALALLPRAESSRLWSLLLCLMLVWTGFSLWRFSEGWTSLERTVLLTSFAASPFLIASLYMGAFSIPVLLALLNGCAALKKRRQTAGGLWLAAATVKPQLVLLPVIGLLAAGSLAAVGAFVGACGLLSLASLSVLGGRAWPDYLLLLRIVESVQAGYGVEAWKMPNLRSLLVWMPNDAANTCALAALMGGAMLVAYLWRRRHPFAPLMAFTVPLGIFLSPHTNPQDGLALFVPAVLLYDYSRSGSFALAAVGLSAAMNLLMLMGAETAAWRMPLVMTLAALAWACHYLCRRRLDNQTAP